MVNGVLYTVTPLGMVAAQADAFQQVPHFPQQRVGLERLQQKIRGEICRPGIRAPARIRLHA